MRRQSTLNLLLAAILAGLSFASIPLGPANAADKVRTIKYAAIQDSQGRYLTVGDGRQVRFVKATHPQTFWTLSISDGHAAIATQQAREYLFVRGVQVELSTAGNRQEAIRWRVITRKDVHEPGVSLRGILQIDGAGEELQVAVADDGTLKLGKSGEKLLIDPWSP